MILDQIYELTIIGVFDRGVPDRERIILKVNDLIDIGQFGILLGIRQQAGVATPLKDNFFWFGDGLVDSGDWIFVYSGAGTVLTDELPGSKNKIYSLHWGRDKTIFNNAEVAPMLFRMDGVLIPVEVPALPTPSTMSE